MTPRHVAIIMDGNGRWAKGRRRVRTWGHVRGASVVSSIVEKAVDINLRALTLYAFSTENWSRPPGEIGVLFRLLRKYLEREKKRILDQGICFKIMGNLSGLEADTVDLVKTLEQESSHHQGLRLSFAFNYGGRSAILEGVNRFIQENPGRLMGEEEMEQYLHYPNPGDVDLLIRTGGDRRISNFLLWQSAYAEFHFTKTKWPEFGVDEFERILEEFSFRTRRFGTLSEDIDLRRGLTLAAKGKKTFLEKSSARAVL